MSAASAIGLDDLGAVAENLANTATYPDAISALIGDVGFTSWVEQHLELRGDAQHPLHGARGEREAREHDRVVAETNRPARRERDVVKSRRRTSRQARTRGEDAYNALAGLSTRTVFKYNVYKGTMGGLFLGDVAGGTTALYNHGDPVGLAAVQMLSVGASIVACSALGAKFKERELARDRVKMEGKLAETLREDWPQLFIEPGELAGGTKVVYALGALIGLSSGLGLFFLRYVDDPVAAISYFFLAAAVAAGSWVAGWANADPVDDLLRNSKHDLVTFEEEYNEAPLKRDSECRGACSDASSIRKEAWMEGLAAELELLATGKLVNHLVPSINGHGIKVRMPSTASPATETSENKTGGASPAAPGAPTGAEPEVPDVVDLNVVPAQSVVLRKDPAPFQPTTAGGTEDKNHLNGATP